MKARENLSERAIVETITRYVGREVAAKDDFADDIGLDSIDRLSLVTAVEQAHAIELSDEEIASISTLRDLLNLLKVDSGESGPGAEEKKAWESVEPQARHRPARIQPKGGNLS